MTALPPVYHRILSGYDGGDAAEPERWCPHTPTVRQQQFLDLECVEALYGGAAGGGKSDALLMAALAYVDVPGYSAVLFRRTYTDLALPGAVMDRAQEWLAGTSAHWSGLSKQWTFPSGATLAFGYLAGARDRYRYQSAEFQFVGFDELTQFEQTDYTYLFSRLRRTEELRSVPLRMRAATNPGGVGHDWVKQRFLDAPEDRIFVPAKLEDNPHLDQAEYEESLAKLDPVTRQQLRDGVWIRDPSGLVYSSWDDERNTCDELPALPHGEEWRHIFSADFGVTDPTAFAVWAFSDHDPCAYLVRSDQWVGLAPSEAAEIARQWDADCGGVERMVGDIGGLGKGFEAEWRKRFRLPLQAAAKNDKLGYIKLLNGDMSRGLVRVVRSGNEQMIQDIRALPWSDQSHQREHSGSPNHLPDAALYGWREVRAWDWQTREEVPRTELQIKKAQADQRKQKLLERNRRTEAGNDSDDWIMGP